jgi:hypothetical protein
MTLLESGSHALVFSTRVAIQSTQLAINGHGCVVVLRSRR